MKRKIIRIDEEKCNGCGACAEACHEGAIAMVGGKAHLMREDYCDGLGSCLPVCPAGAISFEERDAPAYDEAAVRAAKGLKGPVRPAGGGSEAAARDVPAEGRPGMGGCPGEAARTVRPGSAAREIPAEGAPDMVRAGSQLRQWPVQIKLAPVNAPWFDGARLLVAADCTAYAYGSFHEDFIRGRVTLVGYPKLDGVDYSVKLEAIFRGNDIRDITVARMEVPCCGALEYAVRKALRRSGRDIPLRVVTICVDGRVARD